MEDTYFVAVVEGLKSQDIWEYLGLIFGIAYVIFAAFNKPICWIFGIVSCALICFKDFTAYQLYMDGVLQVFYILMGFWGLYNWVYGSKTNSGLAITSLNLEEHRWLILGGLIVSVGFGYIFDSFTDASFPWLDSFTTVFSIYATYLMVKRIYHTWLFWILLDLIYVYLYYAKGAIFFSFLMVIYTVIAVFGAFNWLRLKSTFHSSI